MDKNKMTKYPQTSRFGMHTFANYTRRCIAEAGVNGITFAGICH